MTKINIQNINIELRERRFEYYQSDKKEENEKYKKTLKEIEDFRKNNSIVSEKNTGGWSVYTTFQYYVGSVKFMPIKEGGSSIQMDIKVSNDFINSIIAMSLNNVCELCEKQTKAFQNTFVDFVKDNSEALTNQTQKIKKGLLARVSDKLLTNNKNDK